MNYSLNDNKKNIFEIVAYILLSFIIFLNHKSFFFYIFNWDIIQNVWIKELFFNLIYTPVIFLIFIFCFWGLGKRLAAYILNNDSLSDYNIIISISLGMGLYNLLLEILGFARLLYASAVWALICFGILCALYEIFTVHTKKYKLHILIPSGRIERIFSIFIVLALGYGVVEALSPPTSIDALYCHLPVAKQYAVSHKISPDPLIMINQCSTGLEMLTAGGLLLHNDLLAQLFPIMCEILLLMGIFIFTKKHFSIPAAWASMALFCWIPVVQYLSGIVNNDLASALYVFIAVISLWEYWKKQEVSLLWSVGIFGGLAAGSKITGLISLCWMGCVIIALFYKKKINIKDLLVPAIFFIIFSSPTYVRNILLADNPVYPLLYEYIGGKEIAQSVLYYWAEWRKANLGVDVTLWNFFLLPYHFLKDPKRFEIATRYFHVLIFIIFPIQLLSMRKISALEKFLFSYITCFCVVWFVIGHHTWRYMLHIMPFMCILVIIGWQRIKMKAVKLLLGIILIANWFPVIQAQVNNNLFAVWAVPSMQAPGMPPRRRYLQKSLRAYDMYLFIDTRLPAESKILLFQELLGYYLEREYVHGDPLRNVIVYDDMRNSEDMKIRLRKLGITHVLVNPYNYDQSSYLYTAHVLGIMDKFTQTYCRIIQIINGVELYEIVSP